MREARSLIALALDLGRREEILATAKKLAGSVGFLKIGLEAFVSEGPSLVPEVTALGLPVFLDLKLHDIPNTVKKAAAAAARTGASIVNVHASGGADMMKAALEGAAEGAAGERPKVIGVTVLTSLSAGQLSDVGFEKGPRETALRLAVLTKSAGLDGVVCSPEEIEAIRRECGDDFYLIVPGIRPAGAVKDDQTRIATPGAAVRAGASLLVIGRPITQAADPAAAARAIQEEIASALGT
jgi:orotidine-5'-phosphate decarboxylase